MPSFSGASEADSDTSAPDEIDNLRTYIAKLEQKVNSLELENKQLLKNVDELLESQFGIAQFKDSDSEINFYTGFPNFQTLLACYNFLNPGENGSNIVYVNSAKEDLEFSSSMNADGFLRNKPGPRRKLSTLDEFFLVLVRMRLVRCCKLENLTLGFQAAPRLFSGQVDEQFCLCSSEYEMSTCVIYCTNSHTVFTSIA